MIIEKLEKTPRISGTAFENKAKTLFTIVAALLYMVFLSLNTLKDSEPIFYYFFLAAGIETVIIALLEKKAYRFLRMLPITQYVLVAVSSVYLLARINVANAGIQHWYTVYALFAGYFLIRSLIDFFKVLKKEDRIKTDHRIIGRCSSLVKVVTIDIIAGMVSLVIHPVTMLMGFSLLAKFFFYLSTTLLIAPNCIFINVKRITRIVLMFCTTAGLSTLLLKLGLLIIGNEKLTIYVAIVACIFTAFVLLFKLSSKFILSLFIPVNETLYSYGEDQSDSVRFKNEYIFRKAMERNYPLEYSERWWNVSFYTSEISAIQSDLDKLTEEYAKLAGDSEDNDQEHLNQIQTEMIRSLGKLNDDFDFENGFSNIRMDIELSKTKTEDLQ